LKREAEETGLKTGKTDRGHRVAKLGRSVLRPYWSLALNEFPGPLL
jgi:hypothetical protein